MVEGLTSLGIDREKASYSMQGTECSWDELLQGDCPLEWDSMCWAPRRGLRFGIKLGV